MRKPLSCLTLSLLLLGMSPASFADKRLAFAAGARFFINKPYRGNDLVAAVDAAASTAHRVGRESEN